MDLTFGIGYEALGIIGGVVLVAGLAGKKIGLPKQARGYVSAIGLIAVLLALAAYAGLGNASTQSVVGDNTTYEVTATESQSYLTYDKNTHAFTLSCIYNDTSDAFVSGTGVFDANFTISWASGPVNADSVAKCSMGSVPSVAIVGAVSQPIVEQTSDFEYNALFTHHTSIATYETANVLVEYGGSSTVNLHVVLNAAAMAGMSENDMEDVHFDIAGQDFVLHVMKDVAQA